MKTDAPPEWHRLFNAALNDQLSDAERAELATVLKSSAEARQLWFLYQDNECSLAELKPRRQENSPRMGFPWLSWRPLTAAAAGIAIGLFCATVAWAVASSRVIATAERLFALVDGGFETRSGPVPSGFPAALGVWSGDEAEIVTGDTREGRRMLRFISPSSDASDPQGRAISCDVFQLVDLRPLRPGLNAEGDSVLELSADFLDARRPNTNPSVTFLCQLFLFKGDPEALHKTWPRNNADTVSSGSADVTTLGGGPAAWKKVTAKCFVPADADFAVVQIAARPNLRPAKLESLFADDIQLTLKTQPRLPVRVVQH